MTDPQVPPQGQKYCDCVLYHGGQRTAVSDGTYRNHRVYRQHPELTETMAIRLRAARDEMEETDQPSKRRRVDSDQHEDIPDSVLTNRDPETEVTLPSTPSNSRLVYPHAHPGRSLQPLPGFVQTPQHSPSHRSRISFSPQSLLLDALIAPEGVSRDDDNDNFDIDPGSAEDVANCIASEKRSEAAKRIAEAGTRLEPQDEMDNGDGDGDRVTNTQTPDGAQDSPADRTSATPPLGGDFEHFEPAEAGTMDTDDLEPHPLPPRPSPIAAIRLSHEYLDLMKDASLAACGLDDDVLDRLLDPPQNVLDIEDPELRLSLNIFLACRNASQATYEEVAAGIRDVYPEIPIMSYYIIKKQVAQMSGVAPIAHDMCPNSCLAYTGPHITREVCPECGESRYDTVTLARTGEKIARQTFHTIPLGPMLQAQFASPKHAKYMEYRKEATEKVYATWFRDGSLPEIGDVFTGTDYLESVRLKEISEDDIILMFSIDGAQLYMMKQSDCWIYIWVLLSLPPELRYKKQHVLPGGFIPGPKAPKDLDSFLFPGLFHLAALQKEGLQIWNAGTNRLFTSFPYVLFVTADTVGLAAVDGLVGHSGKHGCRRYCDFVGRRKPGESHYYYPIFKPTDDYDVPGCNHGNVDIWKEPETMKETAARYNRNLQRVEGARTQAEYEILRRETGISKPSIFSGLTRILSPPACYPIDLMHLVSLNVPALFIDLWTGKIKVAATDDSDTWSWVFLIGEVFAEHGQLVEDCLRFFPGSFDRPPRNPFKRGSSGYKAWEFLHWIYGLAPGLLHGIMPAAFYAHFTKAVAALRVLHQRFISFTELQKAYQQLNEVCLEFEELYCEKMTCRVHFIRHSIHLLSHVARDAMRTGVGIYTSQWTMERTIGILSSLIRQHQQPYANLSRQGVLIAQLNSLYAIAPVLNPNPEGKLPRGAIDLGDGYILKHPYDSTDRKVRAPEQEAVIRYLEGIHEPITHNWDGYVTRCGRLQLPMGQTARTAWKECERDPQKVRVSRNVKIVHGGGTVFAEVQFFFMLKLEDNTVKTLAMVSTFGPPDPTVLAQSHGTYYSCLPEGDEGLLVVEHSDIRSVVGMIPRGGRFFVLEKMGLGAGYLGGAVEDEDIHEG